MAIPTLDDIRGVILDYPQYNILLDDVEFTDAEIQRTLQLIVDRFNAIPPRTGLTVEGFPNRYMLIMGVIYLLFFGEASRQARNQFTYQAGDVAPIGIDDKASVFSNLAGWAQKEFLQMATAWKLQDNLEACFGSLGSGYAWVVSRFP